MAMVEMIQERLQQPLVDVRISNDVSTVGIICKMEFGENFKGKTPVEYGPLCSEKETRFIQDHSFDASLLEPLTAMVLVSTTNRRLLGRMVPEEVQIYLALPYIAAASASTVGVSRFM